MAQRIAKASTIIRARFLNTTDISTKDGIIWTKWNVELMKILYGEVSDNMINVLAEDYIVVAKAKGLPIAQIRSRYAARNAILPSVSGFAMALGFIIGGSLLTEMVFSYPGIGFMLYQAVQQQDYPLIQAIFLFIAIAVMTANFLSDMVIMLLDPRVRDGGKK